MTRLIALAITAACLALPASAQQQQGNYHDYSNVTNVTAPVPTTATTVIPAASGLRIRLIVQDTCYQAGQCSTTAIWCAFGTSVANPAVINGNNSWPLATGIDDGNGIGVNQGAVNCIQSLGSTRSIYAATY